MGCPVNDEASPDLVIHLGGRPLRLTGEPKSWPYYRSWDEARTNWQVYFFQPPIGPPMKFFLERFKGVIFGLSKHPQKFLSHCEIASTAWSFWTRDATETEIVHAELEEIASGRSQNR